MLSGIYRTITDWIDKQIPEDIKERAERVENSCNSYGFDEWGFSPEWSARALTIGSWLYRNYFRATAFDVETFLKKAA